MTTSMPAPETSEATRKAVDAGMDRIIAGYDVGGFVFAERLAAAIRAELADAETRAASWEAEAHKLEGAAVALGDIRRLCEGEHRQPAAEVHDRVYADGRVDFAATVTKIIDGAPYKKREPTDPPTMFLSLAWRGDFSSGSSPIFELRHLQAMAPFRPTSFLLGPKTALAFLGHPETVAFVRDFGCVEVLERQAKNFHVLALGTFEVDETVPEGEVHLVDENDTARAVLARLMGALREPEQTR